MSFVVVKDDNGASIITVATAGYQTANTNNAAATTGGADYSFKWGTNTVPIIVNHIMIQNNTGANINWDLDVVTTAGSPLLATGQTLFLDVQCTVLHLQSAGAQNVNGSNANNIVVRGWL